MTETLIPVDETLIDNVFEAGMELLVNVGILCTSTERLIKLTETEIKDKLASVKSEVVLGRGKEAVIMKHRDIEDKSMPVMFSGPVCVPMSEEIASAVYESYANEESVATLYTGTLTEVSGVPVVAGSPSEMHAEKVDVARARTAFRNIGRPGICIEGSSYCDPISSIGACDDQWGYGKGDMLHASCLYYAQHENRL